MIDIEKDFDQMVADAIMDTIFVPNPVFERTDTVCRFNGAVDCESKGKCRNCGWNHNNIALRNRRVDIAMKRREAWLNGRW